MKINITLDKIHLHFTVNFVNRTNDGSVKFFKLIKRTLPVGDVVDTSGVKSSSLSSIP